MASTKSWREAPRTLWALVLFVVAGSNVAMLWLAILLLGTFNFVESPQLQALLSDLTPPALRAGRGAEKRVLNWSFASLRNVTSVTK